MSSCQICSLEALKGVESSLLDSATVFQTVNGHERIYMMPYSLDSGLREVVLTEFEEEMLARSASKVKDSAEAVKLLHSKEVLREGYGPKGRSLRGNNL